MKKCPNCQRTFDDTMNFCQFDAAALIPAASSGLDDLPPTVAGAFSFPPPPPVNNKQQTPQWQNSQWQTPAFQTSQLQPSPNFNQPNFSGAAQNQPVKGPGNRWTMAGLGFMIAASVLTVFGLGFNSFGVFGNGLAYGSIEGYNAKFSLLPMMAILLTIIAGAFAVLALLLKIIKPDYYGRRNSSISVLLVSLLLFGIQSAVMASSYSKASAYTRNNNYPANYDNSANYGRNTANNYVNRTVSNSAVNSPSAPAPLQTAIIGTWRDSVGATITFYADKSLIINDANGKKIADGDYEITGSNKFAMFKNGTRVKEYSVFISGNRMTMDGETMTKIY